MTNTAPSANVLRHLDKISGGGRYDAGIREYRGLLYKFELYVVINFTFSTRIQTMKLNNVDIISILI